MTKETSQKIRNMGFICALFVVSIHINWHTDESQLLWWGRQLIKGGIAGIAVPFFFVVSGYFLAAHFDEDGWWKREVGKRIKSLIVPFYLWTIIWLYHFMPTKAWPNWLTSCAFPIFLMHPITFQYLGIVQKHMPPMCVEAQTLIQFVGGAAVPIAVAVLLRRFFPKTASILFGGR